MVRKVMAGCCMVCGAALLWSVAPSPASAEAMQVPEDIYKWVQSSARQDYWFNMQQMRYGVTDMKVDKNILIVPTLRVYDDVQINDIVTKRRWRNQSVAGYNRLACAAEYLRFDLQSQQVEVMEHDDLDDQWGTIAKSMGNGPVSYANLPARDLDMIFYQAIIKYAAQHPTEMQQRAEWAINNARENNDILPY